MSLNVLSEAAFLKIRVEANRTFESYLPLFLESPDPKLINNIARHFERVKRKHVIRIKLIKVHTTIAVDQAFNILAENKLYKIGLRQLFALVEQYPKEMRKHSTVIAGYPEIRTKHNRLDEDRVQYENEIPCVYSKIGKFTLSLRYYDFGITGIGGYQHFANFRKGDCIAVSVGKI
ncbi:MAG: hypothetical protein WCT08_05105 [Patescibacteria group bacterium]|jgi:hypothetical protein